MWSALRDERTHDCISDMRFDAWQTGELTQQQVAALHRHLAICGLCRNRKLLLARERARFAATEPELPAWLPQSPPRMVHRRWLVASACAAAAAALAIVYMPRDLEVRAKGREHVSFYIKRGEDVQRGRMRETLYPGDRLRFAYTALRPRYLTILSLDGAGQASLYYPSSERASRIDAGADVLLPSSVELDAVLGEEHIVALFCDDALPVAPLMAALEAGRLVQQKPQGCSLDELIVFKQPGVRP